MVDLIREGAKLIYDRAMDSTDVIRKVSYEILIKCIENRKGCVTSTCDLLEIDQTELDELV